MLLHGWSLLHQALLQVMWWGLQYGVLGNIADHPARPVEAELAYACSFMEQADSLLEVDVVTSQKALQEYFVESVGPEVVSRGIDTDEVVARHAAIDRDLRPAASAACSGDGYEVLRRDAFGLWPGVDHGLLGQLLREALAGQRVSPERSTAQVRRRRTGPDLTKHDAAPDPVETQ
ncbi:unnamed protein product [Prorocentrum cordatum]|uniref:Uncharacterized protein n=1 Tax=Prorocentrum cordatum TaxID=2364126 RepID=A0ABN9WE23_9DINO|nr:unnamed protein product [Polarella glacialis]